VECVDKGYAVSSVRSHALKAGAFLADVKDAEVIIELRIGALATDYGDNLVGLPPMDVPIPFAGQVTSPELYLFKKVTQRAIGKLALFARMKTNSEEVFNLKPVYGETYYNRWWVTFFSFETSNLPRM